MLKAYYRDRDVRARLDEYCGVAPGSGTTAAYVASLDPSLRGPEARWETAQLGAPDVLDDMLERGGDVARSLWDRDALLFHLDLDYQNTDAPGEPFAWPAEAFFRLEPAYRAVRREMLRFGLPLFVLMTGRGYHFTGRVRLDHPLVSSLAALVPGVPRWHAGVASRRPPGVDADLSPAQARAHAGLGCLVEYFAHRVMRRVGLASPAPVVVNGTVVGTGLTGRAAASLDFSHLGDPLDARLIRMAYSAYQLHRMRPDQMGERIASEVPPLAAVPRPRGVEEALLSRTLPAARQLAAQAPAAIPEVSDGLQRLFEEYTGSRLAAFHRDYVAACAADEAAPAAAMPPLPPCVSWPLDEPNDRLLQPAFIQQLTRALIAHGWAPAAIARRVHERYAADAGWGDHWARRDRWTRATFDVGVFAALIHAGLDEGVDFNCVSAQEKGLCPGTGCPYNLADIRDRMLAG
ncbi:MAG TPA: hypothetical protein VFZ36_08220 [Vicinamibacterales bacterium]